MLLEKNKKKKKKKKTTKKKKKKKKRKKISIFSHDKSFSLEWAFSILIFSKHPLTATTFFVNIYVFDFFKIH